MNGKKSEILHSEPVREIMGSPPGKLVAWGTTAIFVIFLIFIAASWFIRYPDVIPARVEISTVNPPATLTSRVNGRISEILNTEGDTVGSGQIIIVMEATADYKKVLALEQYLTSYDQNDSLPQQTGLGELQQAYSLYMVAHSRLIFTKTNDYLGKRIEALNTEIGSTERYIRGLSEREKLFSRSIKLEVARFERDSILFLQSAISAAEYEKSMQEMIAQKMELQNTALEIISATINLSKIRQELQELLIKRSEEFLKLETEASALKADLLSDIAEWKRRFMLISPIKGVVTFTRIWGRNQFVEENESVVTIVPEDRGVYIGRMALGLNKSGKVSAGMSVNIRLSSFPYLEYGMVRGVVMSRSLVPEGDLYYVEISLPDGLRSLYGKDLPFSQNMQGTAEIMTDDLNIMQKIVDPIRFLITRYRTTETNQRPE
jgi:multidrug efflux pump subunit AcrA (membrane-fusion protein)